MKSVVGHHAAQRLLAREALSGKVSHAYLITGPEQTGKTTLALEFARLLQCQKRDADSPEPCGARGDRSRRYMSKCIMRAETHAKRGILQIVGYHSPSEVEALCSLSSDITPHNACSRARRSRAR